MADREKRRQQVRKVAEHVEGEVWLSHVEHDDPADAENEIYQRLLIVYDLALEHAASQVEGRYTAHIGHQIRSLKLAEKEEPDHG